MKYIYSKKFDKGEYAGDPAADEARFDAISAYMASLPAQDVIEPRKASEEEILRAHGKKHYEWVKKNDYLFRMARLAASGAIVAAREAMKGMPAFAVIRPPGHHASRDSCWGFCFFNNMAVAILDLLECGAISSAFILDFDLHVGDGNINILSGTDGITIYNPDAATARAYVSAVKERLENEQHHDVIACSAGFDKYEHDWGGLLATSDFKEIGLAVKKYAIEHCNGRRFALLEGGYNYGDLALNIDSFCSGFK